MANPLRFLQGRDVGSAGLQAGILPTLFILFPLSKPRGMLSQRKCRHKSSLCARGIRNNPFLVRFLTLANHSPLSASRYFTCEFDFVRPDHPLLGPPAPP